jgi:hypothetical protein
MPGVVSNTGHLLALANIGQFDLFRQLFDPIVIPPAVRAEVKDETSLAALTAAADWIAVQRGAGLDGEPHGGGLGLRDAQRFPDRPQPEVLRGRL